MTRDGDVFLYDFNSGVVTNTTNDWDNGNNMVVFQKGTNNIVYNRNETGWVAFNVLLYQKNIVSGSISLVVGSSGYSFPNTNIFPTDANQNFIYYRRGGDHGGTRFLYRKNMNNGQESTVVNVTGRGGTEISTNIVSWLDFSNNIHLWTTNGVEIGVFNVSTISNFNFDFYYNGISANDNNYDLQWLGKWPNNNSQINWSTNETTPTITITPTQTTTYTATVTQGNQTCSDSITITVNPLLTWYADADADGFGNPDDVVQDCNQPQGYVSDNTDCNDEEATTYPGASEICDNNRDENCDGVDSLCFVPVLGCMDVNACNFNPEANTEDNSCILPQLETCNGLDDNCNGQIDEGFTLPSLNAASVIPAIYPTCTGNAIRSANLSLGVDSPIITGNGNDLWYTFTAQYNTLRVGLSAAFGDNSISLYSAENGCLELIMEEHETYVPTTLATGNQILLTDELTVGQTYYVAVHQITGPSNSSAKVCFTYLNGTTCDHYYSGNTGVYTNVCNSFKAQYRANASNYIFNILSATQNGTDMNVTPWSYTNNNANSVVSRLGSILPANHSGFNREYTLNIPVMYGLPDAAGNMSSLMANPTSTCTIILNSEATIALRTSDRCPINKSLSSTIAPDRTVCGAIRYEWEFTEVLPSAGAPQVVQGGAYASVFFLSNIPGVAVGKT
jgi:hypothetical protein